MNDRHSGHSFPLDAINDEDVKLCNMSSGWLGLETGPLDMDK